VAVVAADPVTGVATNYGIHFCGATIVDVNPGSVAPRLR
jgi:hypothetical protein